MPEHSNNIVLHLAYDGTSYFGWQKTESGPTIEGTLEEILKKLFQHPISLQAASRTDRGVHADGQVANFFTTKLIKDFHRLHSSLNQLLPHDIRVLKVESAPNPSFHPTLDTKAKEYHYRIANTAVLHPFMRLYYWHIAQQLNIDDMLAAAALLQGTHDFSSLRNSRKNQQIGSIRVISNITIDKQIDTLTIKITGTNFLYKMARNIAGTLIYVGLTKISPQSIPDILNKKNRSFAGVTAPACGLTLHKVYY